MTFLEDFNTFTGSGFAPEPNDGQLDSDAWSITGLSDGELNFGASATSGDFARGTSTGGVTTGGIYAFEVESGNSILGVQPTGSDFTPGEFILKLQNDGDTTVTEVDVDYIIYFLNNATRANSLNFSYSEDGDLFTSVNDLDFTTPEAADTLDWQSEDKSTTISGLDIAPDEFLFLKWTGDDVSGGGSRDEYGIDDIQVTNLVAADGEGNNGGGEPTLTSIYDIQGTSHTSPLIGQAIVTTGIVTAVDSDGFYLQDATGDEDIATSDAIFVFTDSAPGVSVGDELQVEGTVSESFPGGEGTGNLSRTQISGSPTITTLSTGNTLPEATIIGADGRIPPSEIIDDDAFGTIAGKGDFDPETDGIDFFESVEGMLVTAKDTVAVGGTTRFGEIFTVVDGGADATGISERSTLNISPDDFNPEKVQIDANSDILPGFDFPEVDAGDSLGDITGVVTYSFGNFEINPTQPFTINDANLTPEVTSIQSGEDELTIASYNVLNLDPNDGDGDTDVADGRFDAIAKNIVNNLNSPDLIGLQEVQDNTGSEDDGVVAADETLQQLVDAIAANGGPTYEFIDNTFIGDGTNGGQPGGNIRTAFYIIAIALL